ncbi:MAG: chemotaxis protein CheX [Candidatus Riflebacteria bacterium]|nr:chemotaxis protein CheX [Candidatus Riflebacteria bacterium]
MIFPPDSLEAIIFNALSETVESMVFEEVVINQFVANKWPQVENSAWWACIELFPPPISGEVIIVVPDALMNRFTEATLGMGDEPPLAEENADALGELLNTLCGRLLAMRVGPTHTFRMGLPKIGRGDTMTQEGNNHKLVDCLVEDDHIYLVVPNQFWDFNAD